MSIEDRELFSFLERDLESSAPVLVLQPEFPSEDLSEGNGTWFKHRYVRENGIRADIRHDPHRLDMIHQLGCETLHYMDASSDATFLGVHSFARGFSLANSLTIGVRTNGNPDMYTLEGGVNQVKEVLLDQHPAFTLARSYKQWWSERLNTYTTIADLASDEEKTSRLLNTAMVGAYVALLLSMPDEARRSIITDLQ